MNGDPKKQPIRLKALMRFIPIGIEIEIYPDSFKVYRMKTEKNKMKGMPHN